MIIKTQAIALNIRPFSESSHIVSWLTADHGKIATIIKGAQRPRNIFLGQYDLFYTCELLFYLRLFQGLHIVKECSPLKSRSAFRSYWPGTACASYFPGLTAKTAPLDAPQRNLYTLLEAALDFFAEDPASQAQATPRQVHHGGQALETGIFWFELKLLGALGYAPRLNACLQCQRPLTPSRGAPPAPEREHNSIAFSAERGGALCGKCAGQNRDTSGRIAPDSLALLRFWQSSGNIQAIRNVVCSQRQIKDVGIILGSFLQHHLETENSGREAAFSILRQWQKINFDQPLKI
jgi:DNA repair protein RecO (recombination protein O)